MGAVGEVGVLLTVTRFHQSDTRMLFAKMCHDGSFLRGFEIEGGERRTTGKENNVHFFTERFVRKKFSC